MSQQTRMHASDFLLLFFFFFISLAHPPRKLLHGNNMVDKTEKVGKSIDLVERISKKTTLKQTNIVSIFYLQTNKINKISTLIH